MANHDIVVMGASAGGVDAIRQVVASLPRDLPADKIRQLLLSSLPEPSASEVK